MKAHVTSDDELDTFVNEFVRSRIRLLRQAQGLSMKELASKSGIPSGSYTNLENGFYRISLPNLYRILDALGADISEVWPPRRAMEIAHSQTAPKQVQLVDIKQINLSRLRELCVLTRSQSAAVLVSHGLQNVRCLFSVGVSESVLEALSRLGEETLSGWQTYVRRKNSLAAYPCLKNPDPAACRHLQMLIGAYLDLWLAEIQI